MNQNLKSIMAFLALTLATASWSQAQTTDKQCLSSVAEVLGLNSHNKVELFGKTEINGRALNCRLEVQSNDERSGVTAVVQAFDSNKTLVSGGTALLLQNEGNTLSQVEVQKCQVDQNINVVFSTQQSTGWHKKFQNVMTIERDTTGRITKAFVKSEGPFNAGDGTSCSF